MHAHTRAGVYFKVLVPARTHARTHARVQVSIEGSKVLKPARMHAGAGPLVVQLADTMVH